MQAWAHHFNAVLLELLCGPDATEHQQLRCVRGTCGENYLPAGSQRRCIRTIPG